MRSQTILAILVTSLISGLSASAKPVRSNLHCSLIGSEDQRVVEHNPSRPTIALALGGGGIRGAAAIGALRALERAHIPIDFIAGTSMGAAVGGMYAAGVPLDQIEKLMIARSGLISVMIPTFPVPIATSLPLDSMRIFGIKHAVGIVTGNAVAKMVDKHLTVEQRQIENFKIPFVAIASNVIDGQSYMVNKGDLGKAVQASGSVPMLFQPVATADGKLLIDGGLRANVPAHQARASHADIVIAVNCDDRLKDLSNGDSSTIHGLSNRALSIMLAEIDQHQLEHADLEIIPSTSPISIYSRSRKDAALAIAAGEAAAVEMMPSIEAKISAFANGSQLTTDSKQSTKEQTYPVN